MILIGLARTGPCSHPGVRCSSRTRGTTGSYLACMDACAQSRQDPPQGSCSGAEASKSPCTDWRMTSVPVEQSTRDRARETRRRPAPDFPRRTEYTRLSTLAARRVRPGGREDRKSTRLNSSHSQKSYTVFCLKKKNGSTRITTNSRV